MIKKKTGRAKSFYPYNSLLAIAVIILILSSCNNYSSDLLEEDNRQISLLQEFLNQEASWAHAIAAADSANAFLAMDSMQAILVRAEEHAIINDYALEKEDSIYFSELNTLWELAGQLTDSIYPAIARKAFLEEMEYTWQQEERIMNMLKTTDSLWDVQLRQLKTYRQAFRKRHKPGPENFFP